MVYLWGESVAIAVLELLFRSHNRAVLKIIDLKSGKI